MLFVGFFCPAYRPQKPWLADTSESRRQRRSPRPASPRRATHWYRARWSARVRWRHRPQMRCTTTVRQIGAPRP